MKKQKNNNKNENLTKMTYQQKIIKNIGGKIKKIIDTNNYFFF